MSDDTTLNVAVKLLKEYPLSFISSGAIKIQPLRLND